MCEGFGMIVTKEIKGYFTTPDRDGHISHTEILSALKWKDNENAHLRNFVRVQCPTWQIESFEFDEEETLPTWAEEGRDEIVSVVKKALRRAAAAWAEYEKVNAAARAEYEKVNAPAWAEYEKVSAAAWAEYEKVNAAARAEYEKVRAAAWERLADRLSKISGFVSAPPN